MRPEIIARAAALRKLSKTALCAILPAGWGHLIPKCEMRWAILAAEFGRENLPDIGTFCRAEKGR